MQSALSSSSSSLRGLCALLLLLLCCCAGCGAQGAGSGGCASCRNANINNALDEQFVIELAKKQILNKLHMRERPNITQTLPRAALATALRKLNVGRVRADGTLELENNLLHSPAQEQAYEIISFSEMDPVEPSRISSTLSFQFLQEQGRKIQVLQSSLWLYVRAANGLAPAGRISAQVYLSGSGGNNRTLLLQRTIEGTRSGWQTFPITRTLQTFLDGGQQHLQLEVHCEVEGQNLCSYNGADASQQPYLVAQVRLHEDDPKHTLNKRSLRCSDDTSICCKKDYYLKFQDIEWQDWIIAPEGYYMNLCMGQCPPDLAGSPGVASSFHATLFGQLKAKGIHAGVSSCCVPTQRRPLSVVYFDSSNKIVKADLLDMIVESCGCT